MSFYDWRDCPAEVKAQVDQLIAVFCEQIPAISGIYLHGSLAMGCFNPAHSDLDLLVITRQKMPLAAVAPLLQTFLNLSKRPIPIEISILNKNDLWPWDHPALYDLHYSEHWREQVAQELNDDTWPQHYDDVKRDSDLAAHMTITRKYGICLWGEAIESAFPEVPPADYAEALLFDIDWAADRLSQYPIYAVLNICRILAFFKDGLILSKADGAAWALQNLAQNWHGTIQKALHCYRTDAGALSFSDEEISSFYVAMTEELETARTFPPGLITRR